MKTVGDLLPDFKIVGVKPNFNEPMENGVSAFEEITNSSFKGKWKVIYYYPKDFTFVCPTEIIEFARIAPEFEKRGAVLMGGSTDNEFCKLAWRREHPELSRLNHYMFADVTGNLLDALGVRDAKAGVAMRATFIANPDNVIEYVSVNPLGIGRSPKEVLRMLDALQTGELTACERPVGGDTLSKKK